MDKADTFLQRHSGSEAERSDAREECGEADLQQLNEEKVRNCLMCRTPFPSTWAGERICRRCKSSARWRSGGLD
jgi:uncharacterized paraquat-inducible protein A